MSSYLTNVEVTEKRPRHAYRTIVRLAARSSGLRVEFRDTPMPRGRFDRAYDSDPGMGSIFTREGMIDHGPFWREYERLWVGREAHVKTEAPTSQGAP